MKENIDEKDEQDKILAIMQKLCQKLDEIIEDRNNHIELHNQLMEEIDEQK